MSNANYPGYRGDRFSGIARDLLPITPSDGADVTGGPLAAIVCKGSAGNVVITTIAGNTRTYPIAAEEVITVGITRVWATGTTATTIWGYIA